MWWYPRSGHGEEPSRVLGKAKGVPQKEDPFRYLVYRVIFI
jgi:hypothetical protein